ncbi:unnamed protein product [Larinioides sclopetarius]|uniref:Uncharacterized protein n=1 Tax=Larinioides sclopetarius TaxID=280406 RepID=A0AAV2B1H8_9ARAC
MDNEMLSRMAEEIINEMEDCYTLNPEQFKRFFLTEAYGKPRPNILPIVRSFTGDVEGVILQLVYFRNSLRNRHEKYMEERKRERKLERRIRKLVEDIIKEVKSEKNEGRAQRSLCQYIQTKRFTARNDFLRGSKAAEIIRGMTEFILDPVEFKRFLLQVIPEKPDRRVLPILRSFTAEVNEVVDQLLNLRKSLYGYHKDYMVEHEKDNNIIERIERLIKNIEKEQEHETRQRRGQMYI